MNKQISRRDFVKGSLAGVAGAVLAGMGSHAAAFADDAEKSFEAAQKWDAEYDVVVIGYGFAGAVSAVRAADDGAKVLLIEKAPLGHEGGNSRYSGQAALTIEDGVKNRDAAFEYLKRIRGKYNTPSDDTLEAFLDSLLTAQDWFAAHGGNPIQKYKQIGEFRDVEGWDLMTCWSQDGLIHNGGTYLAMQKIVESTDLIDVWFSAPAEKFIQDPETKVVHGVQVGVEGKSYNVRAKNGVVLTCGGFENNMQMIQDYHQFPYAFAKGALYNTGDGVRMALDIGADLWHMSNIAGPDLNAVDPAVGRAYGYAIIGPHPLLSTGFSLNSVVLVGADGTRFASESVMPGHGFINYHGMKIRQPVSLPAYLVFDSEAFQKTIYANWDNNEKVADGTIKKADTLDELNTILGLPEGSLAATVAQYNRFCADGNDPQFARDPETLIALQEQGPYYAFEVKPTYTNTQGGPRRNKDGSILDLEGNPIPHLYSAGECGSIWADVYQGAGNIGECFAYGLISGANAAKPKDDRTEESLLSGSPVNFAVVKPEEAVELAENEAVGVGTGIGGDVRVKVTVADGKIISVEVLEHNETPGIGGVAFDSLIEQAVSGGSGEIDGVSGATITSTAFRNAVADALSKLN